MSWVRLAAGDSACEATPGRSWMVGICLAKVDICYKGKYVN